MLKQTSSKKHHKQGPVFNGCFIRLTEICSWVKELSETSLRSQSTEKWRCLSLTATRGLKVGTFLNKNQVIYFWKLQKSVKKNLNSTFQAFSVSLIMRSKLELFSIFSQSGIFIYILFNFYHLRNRYVTYVVKSLFNFHLRLREQILRSVPSHDIHVEGLSFIYCGR